MTSLSKLKYSEHSKRINRFTYIRIQNDLIIILLTVFLSSCIFQPKEKINTVTGEICPDQLGICLEHEHLLVDITREGNDRPEAYTQEEATKFILPHLAELKKFGVKSFVDCTPIYLGRDVHLLERLSKETGIQIITNTGFYGAQNNRFIPEYVLKMTPTMISTFWIAEFEQGIEGTGVKPGFIKIAFDRKPLSDFHANLTRAAAITHKATGLTIMSHTGPSVGAFQQIEILENEGVSPEAFIWTHASDEDEWALLVKAAKMGAWVSLDKYGWKEDYIESYPKILKLMKSEGVLNKVLISQDAGWFDPGQAELPFKSYSTIFKELIPNLMSHGFTKEDIHLLLVENPSKAFTIQKHLTNNEQK